MNQNLLIATQDYKELSSVESTENALPIYRHFEQYAQQFPDAVAATSAGDAITYGQLNLMANQLAHYLISQQIKAQDCIGVLMEAGWEILVAIIAIHKINGIYLPLDTEFPKARIESIVEQAQPSIILCASQRYAEVESSFAPVGIKIINLPQLDLSSYKQDNLNCECPVDSISHIFFTSGTTGTPKGVVSTHHNLIHYIFSAQAKYRFGAEDSFLAATRFTFSISLLMLLLPLVSGGKVNIITQSQLLEPQLLAQAIEQSTFFHLGPSVLKMLLDFLEQQPSDRQQTLKRFAHIKHASSGGDMIPPQILNRLNQIFTHAEVYAIYGSSEISCMGCTALIPKDVEWEQTLVGQPFEHVQLLVLDEQQTPVPMGVKGEIYFAGAGITRGYLNLPQLTGEKYIMLDGQRFYRTGDLGRLTPSGNLQVLGRSDFQVQIRGLRIELADIESNLNLHPAIMHSVVVPREDRLGEKQLVAYLITVDSPPTEQELRSFLANLLPSYMIPSQFVVLERFPLTPNGKIDRHALPAPDEQPKSAEIIAPRTAIEQQLVEIWATVLKLEPSTISVQDNFFALGGHSLLATQVTSRIRDSFQVVISLNSLFEFSTIGELALQIEIAQKTGNTDKETLEIIRPLPETSQIPLSLAQQRLWFLYQMEPQSSAYNIPLALELKGKVDVSVLQQAITEIVRRHQALRTNFVVVEDTPIQVINPAVTMTLPIIDLQALSEIEREQEYQRLATEEADRGFNLTEDSLLRTTLVQLSSDTQVLLVTMHHIIADGWSLEVFTQELASLYSDFIQGKSSSLAELSLQYGDFAAWQRQWSQTDAFSTQVAYWEQQLAS
ncbi:MAG: amino acid adenylation domain-containing protein, partial [Waterburya sp.]